MKKYEEAKPEGNDEKAVPGEEKYEGCCNNNCQKMSKLPKDEQRKIRKARKRPSLTSFKKSIRPQENIAERNINSR